MFMGLRGVELDYNFLNNDCLLWRNYGMTARLMYTVTTRNRWLRTCALGVESQLCHLLAL